MAETVQRCRYGHRKNGCELGHPGCVCADEAMASCTGQCLPGWPGPNVCDCRPSPRPGAAMSATPTERAPGEPRDALEACPHLHMEERPYYVSRFSTEIATTWWCHDCRRHVERARTTEESDESD